jgi:hypothetical protein
MMTSLHNLGTYAVYVKDKVSKFKATGDYSQVVAYKGNRRPKEQPKRYRTILAFYSAMIRLTVFSTFPRSYDHGFGHAQDFLCQRFKSLQLFGLRRVCKTLANRSASVSFRSLNRIVYSSK